MSNAFGEFNTESSVASANPFADNPFTSGEEAEVEKKDDSATETEEAKAKREMAPRLSAEQKKYILQNYHSEGVTEIAKKLEINENQVRNIVKKTRKDLEGLIETSSDEDKAKFTKFIEEFLPKRVSVDTEGNVVRKRRGPAKDDTRSLVEEMLKGLSLG